MEKKTDEKKTAKTEEEKYPTDLERTTTPEGEDIGGVHVPHFQSAEDIWRILPCEVQFVNETEWLLMTGVKKVESTDPRVQNYFLYTTTDTENKKNLHDSRLAGDPVKCRTAATDASKYK